MPNRITRSSVNEQQYSAPQFPTSGFPLSYRRYSSYGLGRIHVAGFHWTMAGDKISGKTSGKGTFHRIVTEVMSPVNSMQYNIFIPLRPLDRTFKKGITPTKLNAMSNNWTMPLFNTRYLVKHLFLAYFGQPYNLSDAQINDVTPLKNIASMLSLSLQTPSLTIGDFLTQISGTLQTVFYDVNTGLIGTPIRQLTYDGTRLSNMADNLYLRDALLDVANNISSKLGSSSNSISESMLCQDFLNLYLSTLLTPWVGRYSYYGELKYKFLRPLDFYRLSHAIGIGMTENTFTNFLSLFTDTPQNEYLIRGIYAVWYERFRNVDLEPVSVTLPDWQEFGSTSIFDMSAGGNLCYLLYRPRPWENDMFVSAQVDDMSRHVYAPIYGNVAPAVSGHHAEAFNNLDANPDTNTLDFEDYGSLGSKPASYNLSWHDQLTNEDKTIECPVPSNINDVLSALDKSFVDVYGLDLNTLRQSQMLEKYLKRNYLFGDEYQDRMLAHYNSRVSDMRINKPEILSQSMDGYEMNQEVSNVSTDETKVGQRTATATLDVNGTEYSTYCEEFGIIFSIVCYMPRGMYDGDCPQNMMSKQIHLPIPEFASNNEEFGRKSEIAGSGLTTGSDDEQNTNFIFGRYPAYHAWRARVDEVGGEFLDEMQDCTFRRFFGMFSDDTTPKLNYFFLHCRPNLGMFANTNFYDMQLYADLVHECFVERVLPTPVEVI